MFTRSKRSLHATLWSGMAAILAVLLAVGLTLSAEKGDAPKTWPALARDYAAAASNLAQADVASAVAYNTSVPNAIPASEIEFLRAAAQAAQDRLVALEAGKPLDATASLVILAEANLKGARSAYARLLRQASLVSVLEEQIRAAKARVDLAEAKLALVKALGDQPPEVRRQWQMQLLLDELVSMRHAIDTLALRE